MVTPVLKLMSASVKLGVVADETEKQQRRSSVGKKTGSRKNCSFCFSELWNLINTQLLTHQCLCPSCCPPPLLKTDLSLHSSSLCHFSFFIYFSLLFCSPSLPMSPSFILLILFCCLSSCSFPISSHRAALIELPRCLFYTITCVQSPFHMQCSLWVTITIKYSSEYSWQMLISNVCDCIAPVYWGDLASFWAHKTFIALGWRLLIISNVGIWQRASNSWSEFDWKQENGQSNVIKINK